MHNPSNDSSFVTATYAVRRNITSILNENDTNRQWNITTMDVNEIEIETTTTTHPTILADTVTTTTETKPVKNDSIIRSDIDSKKIQSDTKDIVIESSDNILQLKRIVPTATTTTQATPRSTQANVFSNAGGNGGTLDDVQTLTADKVIRRRHQNHRRRRQGR